MKLLTILISIIFFNPVWLGDFNKATLEASKEHKLILINFSGSDWCGPCIRLKKEIFESEAFKKYASQNLILVHADFPREKKNQLDAAQVQLNNKLADKFNPDGNFPFTLLVDDHGKILKDWVGYPNESPEKFIARINIIVNANR